MKHSVVNEVASHILSTEEYLEKRKKSRSMPTTHGLEEPEITYSIPIPKELRGGVGNFVHFYPFEKMEPGASFWVPGSTTCTNSAVGKWEQRTGWKMMVRAQRKDGSPNVHGKKGENGCRVWRVK